LDGMASASGPESLNRVLSRQRVELVKDHLLNQGVNNDQFMFVTDRGPFMANPQCREDALDRAVQIEAWPRDSDLAVAVTQDFRVREVEDVLELCQGQEHIFEIHQNVNNYSRLFHFQAQGRPAFLNHFALDDPILVEGQSINGPWNTFRSRRPYNVRA